jgi:glycosyltransferase involved in cell wall biosynthesis
MVESTYPKKKMQVIIIDDASSDGTGRIAQAYAEE